MTRSRTVGTRTIATAGALIGLAMLLAAPAQGAVRKVPQQFPKIQLAVDAANPGDRIEVAKKRNFENVTVNTNNLLIVGVKKGVFVDGHDDATNTHDEQFEINSNRVRIKNLALRQGQGIDCNGERCVLDRLRFRAIDDYCVQATGNFAVVKRSTMVACDSDGIYVNGDDPKVVGNTIRQADGDCINFSSDRAIARNNKLLNCYGYGIDASGGERPLFKGNVIRNPESYGIYVSSGDRARILGNKVANTDDYCVYVSSSDDMRVRGNRVSNCYEGYDLSGENPVIVNNHSRNSDDYGFSINCNSPAADGCDDALIEDNLVVGTSDGYQGMYVSQSNNTGSMRIALNRVFDASYDGFELNVDNAAIVKNVARRSGAGRHGFDVGGDDNQLRKNVATGNADDGFRVDGDDNRFDENLAKGNHGDGIEIESGELDNLLLRNRTIGNAAEGIDNGGTNTNVRRNVSRNNRIDCANDGVNIIKSRNKCADGSNFNVPPEVSRLGR